MLPIAIKDGIILITIIIILIIINYNEDLRPGNVIMQIITKINIEDKLKICIIRNFLILLKLYTVFWTAI